MTEPQDPIQTSTHRRPSRRPPRAGRATPRPSQVQKERDELYDRLLRKTAEFDNFRKRVERERKEFTEWAAADVLERPARGDGRLRPRAAPPTRRRRRRPTRPASSSSTARSYDLVRKRGVTAVETVGTDFDPHRTRPSPTTPSTGAREGEVVEELRKGYMLGERLLRPALVKVAKAS